MGGLVEKCPEAGTAPAGRNADRQEIGGPGAGGRRTIGVRTGTGHVFFLAVVRVQIK